MYIYGICSPWQMLFKNSYNIFICCLQYAWTHAIARLDTVSNLIVYNGIIEVLWLGIMIIFQLRQRGRGWVSQSTLSHGNLANRCGRRSSCYHSPLSETRHVWDNSLLNTSTILIHVKQHVSRVDFFFHFFYPATEVRKNRRGLLK